MICHIIFELHKEITCKIHSWEFDFEFLNQKTNKKSCKSLYNRILQDFLCFCKSFSITKKHLFFGDLVHRMAFLL